MIDKKALRKLYRDLPYGSSVEIRKRIEKDHGVVFTNEYIRACINPDDPRKNAIILDAAIAYRDELEKAAKDRVSKIMHHEN